MPIATSAISGALPAFRPGLAAAQVDQSLRQALSIYDQARQCALLWFCEVLARGLFRELGYASMEQYATESLGFSRNRMWQFMRLARDLERLPPVKQAVASGQLEWTKAQQVARVATARTAQSWVDQAATSSRRELAQKIKKTRAAAKAVAGQGVLGLGAGTAPAIGPAPVARVTITLTLDSLDAARLEAMIEAAKKSGTVAPTATREEAILAGMAALLEGEAVRARVVENAHSPAAQPAPQAPDTPPPAPDLRRRKYASPYKVVLYRCEACATTEVVTSAGRRKLDPASAAATLENAVVHHHNGKNRSAVAPSLREKVLARDGHRCQAPGCNKARFLEIHHVIPREQGGANTLENLITLCSRCHRFAHEQQQIAAAGFLAAAPGP